MIPAFLVTPAAKVAASLGLMAVLSLGYLGWREYQQFIGRQEERAEVLADLLAQQQEATGHYIVREAMKLKNVERAMDEKDRLNARLRQASHEVVVYEAAASPVTADEAGKETHVATSQECQVAPDLVRTVNGLARVLNDTAQERDPAAGGAAGEPAL